VPEWLVALLNTTLGFWAFWLFLFGISFTLFFRKPITALLSRLTKIGAGKWGVEAQEQNPEQKPPTTLAETLTQQPDASADPRRTADALIAKLSRAAYVVEREDGLKRALSEQGLVPDSTETYRVLTAYLASALVTAEFEQLYNILWTTQIQILSDANPRAPVGLSVDEIRAYYVGATVSPAIYGQYAFEEYLRFLTAQQLLVESSVPGHYTITVKGRTLLLYFVHEGKMLSGRVY
jgi:hypothetical protein